MCTANVTRKTKPGNTPESYDQKVTSVSVLRGVPLKSCGLFAYIICCWYYMVYMRQSQEHLEQPLYMAIAKQFGLMGIGIQRKMLNRRKSDVYVDEIAAADEKAFALMKDLYRRE